MPIVKKNTVTLNKGNLFDRKGFIMKEETELLFSREEVDLAQICIESKRWSKPGDDGTLKVFEEKKLWLSGDAVLGSYSGLQNTKDSFEQALRYAIVDGKKDEVKDLKKKLKEVSGLIKQTKKVFDYAKELSKNEYVIRQSELKKEFKGENENGFK